VRRPRPDPRFNPETVPVLGALPTLEAFEAFVRHRPVGRTIVDICRDFGISPGLCTVGLWNMVFSGISWHGGSLHGLVKHLRRRRVEFEPEWDRDRALGIPPDTREDTRAALGFLIGQPPLMPVWAAPPPGHRAVAANGPPDQRALAARPPDLGARIARPP
jgi:hypothetical protein